MFFSRRGRNLKGNDNTVFFQEMVIRNELQLLTKWQEGPVYNLLTAAQAYKPSLPKTQLPTPSYKWM
jgi:hypothetical protein